MIIFVRHGQTDCNKNNRVCGSGTDILVNEVGLQQAKNAAENLKNVPIDFVFCSPMLRAIQTAREILKFHENVPMFLDQRIVERDWREWENTPVSGEKYEKNWIIGGKIPEEFQRKPIETVEHMQARIFEFWQEKLPICENKNVLVVSHDGVGRLSRMFFGEVPKGGKTASLLVENAKPYILKE